MEKNYSFKEIVGQTEVLIEEFQKQEKKPWGAEAMTVELSKQVGDLSKQIMSFENYYIKQRDKEPMYQTSKEMIADDLSDILYCIIRIAKHYKIDLEQAHLNEIKKAKEYFRTHK